MNQCTKFEEGKFTKSKERGLQTSTFNKKFWKIVVKGYPDTNHSASYWVFKPLLEKITTILLHKIHVIKFFERLLTCMKA